MNERAVFEAAIEIADANLRRSFIEKACSNDPELAAKVAGLLASYEGLGSFLEASPFGRDVPEGSTRFSPLAATEPGTDFHGRDAGDVVGFLQPSSKPGSLGVLAHYEVLDFLGQGGFGTVLKAFDEKLHRPVAIKMLSPQLASTSPPRKRFLREARSIAAVKHENIVQVYSVEEMPLPYLVMEFVDGPTLQDKMDQTGPIESPELLHLARQIASGLAAAHDKGMIHRDVKPGNILIEKGAEQKVKITDFGLARTADDASLTQSGAIAGTPMYMAPEQAKGLKLDHRSDLFSLGSVMYAMACGHLPFRAGNTVAVLRRVVEDTPRPLQEVIAEIPDWLVAIIDKLLAKNPDDRFQTAKEVADVLGRCQSQLEAYGGVRLAEELGLPPVSTLQTKSTSDGLKPASVGHSDYWRRRVLVTAVLLMPILAGLLVLELKGFTWFTPFSGWISNAPRSERKHPNRERDDAAQLDALLQSHQPSTPSALAEWIMTRTGEKQLSVVFADKPVYLEVKGLEELPRERFFVYAVRLLNAGSITDDELALLGQAKRLNNLRLASKDNAFSFVSDKGFQSLFSSSVSRTLADFQLDGASLPKVTPEGWLAINRAQAMQILRIVRPEGDCSFIPRLSLPKLQQLSIESRGQMCGFFDNLASRMPNLTALALRSAPTKYSDVESLAKLDKLQGLFLVDCGLKDLSLEKLGMMKELRGLNLSANPEITDRGVAWLSGLSQLMSISLEGSSVSDDACRKLSRITSLSSVQLSNTYVSDEGCKWLAKLPSLEMLDLSKTRVGDGGLDALKSCKTLKSLNVRNCERMTNEGLSSLSKIKSLETCNRCANRRGGLRRPRRGVASRRFSLSVAPTVWRRTPRPVV